MKILKGNLTEARYAFPQQGSSCPLEIISEKTHGENDVAYMADDLGLHRMFNNGSDFAVSLHCKSDEDLKTLLMYIHSIDLVGLSIHPSPCSQKRLLHL